MEERFRESNNVATLTHVMVDGRPISVQNLPPNYPGTRQERLDGLRQVARDLTHCRIGGVAVSLERFEQNHEHVTLGDS